MRQFIEVQNEPVSQPSHAHFDHSVIPPAFKFTQKAMTKDDARRIIGLNQRGVGSLTKTALNERLVTESEPALINSIIQGTQFTGIDRVIIFSLVVPRGVESHAIIAHARVLESMTSEGPVSVLSYIYST